MKKHIRGKRSLSAVKKIREQSFKTNPVRTGCGRFPNLPPPEDEGG